MKLINAALAEKNVKSKELTNELQEKIARHKEMIIKYNLACEEYENEEDEDAATETKLDEQEDSIARNEAEVAAEIRAFEKPVVVAATGATTESTEQKESSVGWLIFGGAVLLVTLGAVNILKKK